MEKSKYVQRGTREANSHLKCVLKPFAKTKKIVILKLAQEIGALIMKKNKNFHQFN